MLREKMRQNDDAEFVSVSLTSDLQFFTRGNMTVESHLVLCHAKCKTDELLQVEDGHFGL